MISDDEIQSEFDQNLEYYREYFSGKDKGGISFFFTSGDDVLGSYIVEAGESYVEQGLLYKARLRAVTQALSGHPTAENFAGSIAVLRELGDSEALELKLKANAALKNFWQSIGFPENT